jgi:hypothetical protein
MSAAPVVAVVQVVPREPAVPVRALLVLAQVLADPHPLLGLVVPVPAQVPADPRPLRVPVVLADRVLEQAVRLLNRLWFSAAMARTTP